MKLFTLFLIAVFATASVVAASPPADKPGLDQLKSLVGTWKGTDPAGKPTTVSYALVSGGNSLMETLAPGEEATMLTVYHLNNAEVMMTHYCSIGNQPRMRADKVSEDGNMMVFKFVDGTNMKSKGDPHMHRLTFTFKDEDHFSQEWVLLANGKENPVVFNFERAR